MTDIKEYSLEEIVNQVVKAKEEIETLEQAEKMLKDEIGDRLRQLRINGTKVGDYLVSRVKRISFPDILLSQAKELSATVEKIDEGKLRALLNKGIKIKHNTTEYIFIKFSENK